MSSPASESAFESLVDVPEGHVRLVLVRESKFYLEIPINIIKSLCKKPVKYLAFLGWCILGVEGRLVKHDNNQLVDTDLDGDERIDDRGLYYYYVKDGQDTYTDNDLGKAVDLAVISERPTSERPTWSSESTESHRNFRKDLAERDVCCMFTGVDKRRGNGMHIIPHRLGSEWFRLIIENRPHEGENVDDLTDINDIRNGVFANVVIHTGFDPREAVILKTPNLFLEPTDIPLYSDQRIDLPEELIYPLDMRYTLQWLVKPDRSTLSMIPDNADATIKIGSRMPMPSDLLLHYNYGAAAVKWWGHRSEVLQNRPNLPRPAVPPALMGPARKLHDRTIAVQKRNDTKRLNEAGAGAAGGGAGEMEDEEAPWDEDDVMLFLWGNSPAATERHRKKQEEDSHYMEQWRQGVGSDGT